MSGNLGFCSGFLILVAKRKFFKKPQGNEGFWDEMKWFDDFNMNRMNSLATSIFVLGFLFK